MTRILPRIVLSAKGLLKSPETLNVSSRDFIRLWGAHNIRTFVSIGANDGEKNDPIAEFVEAYQWGGIMVEPLPENFVRLSRKYENNTSLILENAGIARLPGVFDFYYLKDVKPDEPDWYDQIGSFDRSTFEKNISVDPGLQTRIGVCPIRTLTFEMLMEKHSLESIDLLLIDTEGYDYEILCSIDLQKYAPRLIIFEYEWLTNYERRSAVSLLRNAGYNVAFNAFDCLATR
jgi:FkbM family methyltransferase